MQYFKKTAVSFLITLFVCILPSQAGAVILKGYFPVHEGQFWNFTCAEKKPVSTWAINGTFSLKDVGKVLILLQDDGRFLCLREDWSGLQIYGEYGPDKILIPEKPLLFLPRELDQNPDAGPVESSVDFKVFTNKNGANKFDFKEAGKVSRTVSFRLKDTETIQAGGQEFKDCLVIEKTLSEQGTVTSELIWLAPAVGPVKRIVKTKDSEAVYTLVSYAGPGTSRKQCFAVKDFFPIKAGIKRMYKDPEGRIVSTESKPAEKAKLQDITTTPFEDISGDIQYFAFDDRGLILTQTYWSSYGGLTACLPPEDSPVVLPAVLRPGSFHRSVAYPRSYAPQSMTLFELTHPEMEYSGSVVCIEDITVPAGVYKDCLKICLFQIVRNFELQFDALRIGYVWLARGKGIVKEDAASLFNACLAESVSAIYDVRFWQLSGMEEIKAARLAQK